MKKDAINYSGEGSAIDNYFAPKAQQQFGNNREWAAFNKYNKQHLAILSLCRNAQWETPHPRHGTVPDLERLGHWLRTMAPVKKPIMEMSTNELSKTIVAMEGVVKSIFNKK